MWVLVNHLKSQSFTFGDPDPLRTRQATQVRAIYDQLKAAGADLIAIVGDFNKGPTTDVPPQHPTLEALLGPQSPLFDTQELPVFDPGPRPGTFQACGVRQRLDYILVSPELADLVSAGGMGSVSTTRRNAVSSPRRGTVEPWAVAKSIVGSGLAAFVGPGIAAPPSWVGQAPGCYRSVRPLREATQGLHESRPVCWFSVGLRETPGSINPRGQRLDQRKRRWARRDSNPRHLPCKGSALAN
jgi:hypothetical protein